MKRRIVVSIAAVAVSVVVLGQVGEVWARAGSGGSRGSRSYSSPSRPSSPASPTSPSRSMNQPTQPSSAARPSFMQRFGPMLGGFVLGGLLGSLLFGGGMGGLGGGIGLMDILLIGGGIFALMSFLRRRREAPAYANGGVSAYSASNTGAGGTAVMELPAGGAQATEVEGLAHIRQMDPGFDPAAFAESVRGHFAAVQSAVGARDVSAIRDRLTPEMFGVLLTQCEDLKSARRTNRIDGIRLPRLEVTEAWQEKGRDFVTVFIEGSMVDYTVDDATGQVVDGSKTTPITVEEFWTFTRPVGPSAWKLTAIQTA